MFRPSDIPCEIHGIAVLKQNSGHKNDVSLMLFAIGKKYIVIQNRSKLNCQVG